MDTNKKGRQRRQSGGTINQPLAEKERKDTPKRPRIPVPNTPANPVKPDENPNPTRPVPGLNEPGKNDPTRIDELPAIINKD